VLRSLIRILYYLEICYVLNFGIFICLDLDSIDKQEETGFMNLPEEDMVRFNRASNSFKYSLALIFFNKKSDFTIIFKYLLFLY